MIIKGPLAIGIDQLREMYKEFERCKKGGKLIAPQDEFLAHSEYMGALSLLARVFDVDKWYLDTLRACNDLKTVFGIIGSVHDFQTGFRVSMNYNLPLASLDIETI